MASNVVRMSPAAMPPQPSQQDWVWDGANWVWCGPPGPPPCPPALAPPFPCPPPGFPTPCPPWFPPPAGQAPWYPGANAGVSFSATPPVNPIRGNFWWDGTMLHLFDGAVWVNIGPGAGGASSGVTQIVFSMTATSSLTIAASDVWTILPFSDPPGLDTMSGWSAVTHKYTPNSSGIYQFLIRGFSDGIALVKNDTGTFTSALSSDIVPAVSSQGAGVNQWVTASGMATMNGMTDYVRMWARNAAASFSATGSNPCFTAIKMP